MAVPGRRMEALMRFIILRDDREITVEIHERDGGYEVSIDGKPYEVDSHRILSNLYSVLVNGVSYEATVTSPQADEYDVHLYDGKRRVELVQPAALILRRNQGGSGGKGGAVRAPMPGKVVRVLVKPGDAVESGAGLIILEAMKMQNELQAPTEGIVRDVRVKEGDSVEGNAVLVALSD